jgi:UDPglucose--hexose-1-phosphate uridylyltransferase
MRSSRRASSTFGWNWLLADLRIDPLSGLRAIVAGEEDAAPARFPVLDPDAIAGGDPLASGRGEPDLFAARPAAGAQEVIPHSPEVDSLLDLGSDGLALAMETWQARMRAHPQARHRHLGVDERTGPAPSLPHSHAQLWALPFVPAAVARERERFTAYSDRTQGRNLLDDVLAEEVRRHDRIVTIGDDAVALCPFASRGPFHLQVIPRASRPRFEDEGPVGAAVLHETLARLAAALGELPPFNLWVRTAPRDANRYCWRIELVPRLSEAGGLELGTGVDLCAVAPERAAERLRAVQLA